MILAKKSENEGNFELIPAGTHKAVCYGVFDLGYQKTIWSGKETIKPQVIISWEIDEKITTDGEYKGKRFVISNKYTLSLSEKANLRKHLESWFGGSFEKYEEKGFDIEKLVGKNCLINIVHNKKKNSDKIYANIAGVMALTKGTEQMIPENKNEPTEWIQKKQAEAVKTLDDAPESIENAEEVFGDVNAENDDIGSIKFEELKLHE